jgi:hypothetical protein
MSALVTRRSVSPNSSRLSQIGTSGPMLPRVVVAHRHHVGARAVRGSVDRALRVQRLALRIPRPVVEGELQDVAALDQLRAPRAGQEVTVWVQRVPDADVAEGVDHALVREDPVGDDQIAEGRVDTHLFRHGSAPLSS